MSISTLSEQIRELIAAYEPLTTKEIQNHLQSHNIHVEKDAINTALYGELRKSVIRDVNEQGIPAWKIKRIQFAAAGGLEAKFYTELLNKGVITKDNASLGFTIKNTRNNKRYHLDIAIRKGIQRYNIEIDGFDHIRADALASIQKQIKAEGENTEIDIDWMDNITSFIEYSAIDTKKVYEWCGKNLDWCIKYHEELLWPKDITRNIWLIDKGWKVIRFWNAEIRNKMHRCINEVDEWLDSYSVSR